MLDKQTTTVHSNGLNKDRYLPDKNDVTFALNSIRDNHEGGRQEYQSEPGNEIIAALETAYVLVGWVYGQDDEIYLLSTNNTLSDIGVFKQDRYTSLAKLDLGFSVEYPISVEYRVKNGCERIIYWCDHNGTDYYFNRDRLDDFKTSNVFDPNKFKLTPNTLPVKIDLVEVSNFGGYLPLGSYHFQAEVLDEKENVIFSSDITPQTVIYDDSQNISYYNIDGGLNIEQYDPTIGGVLITNKAITLNLFNLDTSFSYIRMNVFRKINGTQVVDGHTVAELIPINSDSINWTYRGYNTSAGDFPIDVTEKFIDNVVYETAYVNEQVQGRYLRANLKQTIKDYSTYQSYASKITAQWVAEEVEANNALALGNPKNPQTYWTRRGFQGDEVYLPGIMFLHDNGVWSPVFPLIGPKATVFDLELLTVIANSAGTPASDEVWLSDVKHLGLEIGNTVERWKVFNTASVDLYSNTTHPYSYIGQFGYYESEETYPDIRDCNNDLIWGDGPDGNPILITDKVRLFKFPDRRLVPHIGENGDWTVPLGIKFDNIEYPNSTVIGHKFVFADRTDFDKTVVDSGWSNSTVPGTEGGTFIPLNYTERMCNHRYISGEHFLRYISSNVLYNKQLQNFNYYKVNRAVRFDTGLISSSGITDYARTAVGGDLIYSVHVPIRYDEDVEPTRTNLQEEQTLYIEPGTTTLATGLFPEIRSRDFYTGESVSYVTDNLEDTSLLAIAGQIHETWINDPNNTQIAVHNFYTYKKNEVVPYNNFLSRVFKGMHYNYIESLDSNDNIFYGGDTLISENANFRLLLNRFGDDRYAFSLLFLHHYEEHEINTALRHRGSDINHYYWRYGETTDDVNYDRIAPKDGSGVRQWRTESEIPPEYYAYNSDFNLSLYEKAKLAIPSSYDYCLACSGNYPNRIIFSPKSFDEEGFDLYRINKANDYIDLPAHRGAITGIKYQNNQLLVHTEDTTFILQPNPQQISTDQNTAYLTTGDFLSIPPQELIQTDVGTAGLQSKQSQCDTPFGHCWVDQKRGEVFNWNGKLEILSNKGLLQWFKENLPSEARKTFYEIERESFPMPTTFKRDGIGVILYYDPRFKRLMITKKDYQPLDQRDEFVTPESTVVWSHMNEYWTARPSGTTVRVYPTDSTYFENKSWTLSYSFLDQSFTSWHSYNPYNAFSDSNNFYTLNIPASISSTQPHSIYKHLSKTKYQNFYGTKYDFIIEWSNFEPVSSSMNSIYYLGNTQVWDATNKEFKNVLDSFNKMIVYNNDQSTGLQTLVLQDQHLNPYQNNKLLAASKYIIKTDQNYKISGIYDMATQSPVMTKSWTYKKLYPGYIDHVVNPLAVDLNKTEYDWGNILDKQVFVRLFFKPTLDYKKSVILQINSSEQSVR